MRLNLLVHLVTLPPCHLATLSPCHLVTLPEAPPVPVSDADRSGGPASRPVRPRLSHRPCGRRRPARPRAPGTLPIPPDGSRRRPERPPRLPPAGRGGAAPSTAGSIPERRPASP